MRSPIPDQAPPRARLPDVSESEGPGCLRMFGVTALIVLVVIGLGFLWLYQSLSSGLGGSQRAVQAPVRWITRSVVLSDESPVVRGRLIVSASQTRNSSLDVGVNVGVPSVVRAPSPRESVRDGDGGAALDSLLDVPSVRLTATPTGGRPQTCRAPCEIRVSSGLACTAGGCQVSIAVTIELDTGSRPNVPLTVDVAGGATGHGEELPGDLEVDLPMGAAVDHGGG